MYGLIISPEGTENRATSALDILLPIAMAYGDDLNIYRRNTSEPMASDYVVLLADDDSTPFSTTRPNLLHVDFGTRQVKRRVHGIDHATVAYSMRGDKGDLDVVAEQFRVFRDALSHEPRAAVDLALHVEVFTSAWRDIAPDLPLTPDERRVSETLIETANDLAKAADPPRDILGSIFRWFGAKADRFADEFVGAAGKATGVAAGVGLGATVSGQLPHVIQAINNVMHALGS